MGLDVGDLDADGDLDLVVTNFSDETNALYRQDGPRLFRDVTTALGLGHVSRNLLGWGVHMADFDADGRLDLFVASAAGSSKLLRQAENGLFADVTESAGISAATAGDSARWVDFDADGVRDIWHNADDAIGSIANYFARHKWRGDGPVLMMSLAPRPSGAEACRRTFRLCAAAAHPATAQTRTRPV